MFIYLIHETILFYTRTIKICNNDSELVMVLNSPEFLSEIKGKVAIEQVRMV